MNHWLNQLRECEIIGRVENIRGAQIRRFQTWVFQLGAAAGAGAGVQCTGGRSGLKGQRWQMGVGGRLAGAACGSGIFAVWLEFCCIGAVKGGKERPSSLSLCVL